jgi:dihydrofolate reductase
MAKLRVHNISMSVDGYIAGPDQNLENPLGVGGERLHEWVFATRCGREMIGEAGGDEGIDHEFAIRGNVGIGATIMGRNMFGPIRGGWDASDWTGWWGDEPPYHHEVFVLTHHERAPVTMHGGTTFNFVADGTESALSQAFDAADGKDVRLGGGASVIRQYLQAGLVDEMHLVIVPILLGRGEPLFDDLDGGANGMECVEFVASPSVAHVGFAKSQINK